MAWNIADLTEHIVDTVPDRIALIVADEPRTYAQLEERANRLAHHLAAQGIGPGDHVGIYGFNSHAFVETIFAAYKLRAVPVNVNYRYVEAELRYLFDNADLVALVHDAQFAPRIAAVRDVVADAAPPHRDRRRIGRRHLRDRIGRLRSGARAPEPVEGLLTTVAWKLGDVTTYAMEGAIFVTGAAVQWLRDELQIIEQADGVGPLAASVPDAGGVMFVPAFTGLGSPDIWDPLPARGTVLGLTAAAGARSWRVPRSRRWRTRRPTSSTRRAPRRAPQLAELRVDGGASVMDVLCQFQADVLGVRRYVDPTMQETTTLGAAYLAGIAEGVWSTPAEATSAWRRGGELHSTLDPTIVGTLMDTWHRAVRRSRGWAGD